MPGRKKGRQKGASDSKAQRWKKWNDAMRDAREDLACVPKQNLWHGRASAPPRLSATGFRSLTLLLRQRVREDEVDAAAPQATRSEKLAGQTAAPSSYFSAAWTERGPRWTRTLVSLCISQIGRDFLAYSTDDDAVAEAFLFLPPHCLSRLSRSASARGKVADHNIGLLCSPGVSTLWLRGRFTDEGASALLPGLNAGDRPKGGPHTPERAPELAEVYRDTTAMERSTDSAVDSKGRRTRDGEELVDSTLNVSHTDPGNSREAVEGEEEDWETACDRIEASLRGGVSLTSLDVSSPRISADFVKRLAVRIPSLRRLGLRGSLGVVGGPDVVCDHVLRLVALRELDVSHCTWFCNLTLRRLATSLTLRLRVSSALARNSEDPDLHGSAPLQQLDEGTSGWGAPLTPATNNLACGRFPGSGPSGAGVVLVSREDGEDRSSSVAGPARRFRAFTVVCAQTSVTENGARAAEAMSPGLMVVLTNQQAGSSMLCLIP